MANLYEQVEELEKLVGEAQEAMQEDEPEEASEEKPAESPEENPEENPEKKPEEKQPETNAEWALQRRKMKQLELAEARIAELEAASKKPEQDDDKEPNRYEDNEAWLDWKLKQVDKKTKELEEKTNKITELTQEELRAKQQEMVWRQAANELIKYEEAFQKTQPDYAEVTSRGYSELIRSYQNVEPWLTKEEAAAKVTDFVMRYAAQAEVNGVNPAKALYDFAVEKFGKPETKQDKPRADLSKIDRNKQRSASPLVGGGAGNGGQITLESLNDMTNAELLNLDPAVLRRLEQAV